MPTVIGYHEIKDAQHWLTSQKRAELFGPIGITTDGSSLYPKVLKELWPAARHQICEFHVIKEITKAVLHALAKLRKEMTAQLPEQPRGRPSKGRQRQARLIAYRKRYVAELFEHRYLFVRHHLSAAHARELAPAFEPLFR